MAPAEATRRAYLLGLLPEEEAARLEEGYFAEDSTFEELVLAEDDLIDEYLDERLADDERRAFEARLDQRPELAARLEARRRLTRVLRRRVASRGEEWDVPRPGRRRVFLGLAAAAAAVFVTVRAIQEGPAPAALVTAPPPRAASAPQADVIAPPSVPVVLILGAGGIREASTVPTVTLRPEIPALRLRLPVAAAAKTLQAEVDDVDGGAVWRGAARVVMEGGAPQAEAEVPVSALPAGDYIVRYRGLPDGDEEAFFRVRR